MKSCRVPWGGAGSDVEVGEGARWEEPVAEESRYCGGGEMCVGVGTGTVKGA